MTMPTRRPGCAIAGALLALSSIGVQSQDQPDEPTAAFEPIADVGDSPGPHEAIVRLRDGRFLSGVLLEESPQMVVLEIAGVRTPIAIGRIDRLEILPPLDVRYETWRDAISPEQTEEILLLAEWLRARGRVEDALAEIDAAIEATPGSERLKRLRTIIEQQRVLAERRDDRANQQENNRPDTRGSRLPLLDEQAISMIRLLEIDLASPPRMDVPDDLDERLRAQYPTHAASDRLDSDPDPIEVVRAMFELRARAFYPEVLVQEDPPHLARYRSQVHRRWIRNSCATSRCHGGKEAGGFRLASRATDRTAVAYTNLLLMTRHTLEDGRPLIDFNEPERSALLELSLPAEESLRPHPDVPGFRPALPSRRHPRYIAALDWIRSMHRPRPTYPIDTPQLQPVRLTEQSPDKPNQSETPEGSDTVEPEPSSSEPSSDPG